MKLERVEQAARLVALGLHGGARPGADSAYADLIRLYESDPEFKALVGAVGAGLDLTVVDVSLKTGVIVFPASAESRFAVRLADLRKGMQVVNWGLFAVTLVAVSSWFYGEFEDEGDVVIPVQGSQVVSMLRTMCREYARKDGDVAHRPEEFSRVWEEMGRLPDDLGASRKDFKSLAGVVRFVFGLLEEEGFVVCESSRGGGEARYLPTRRFAVSLRELSANALFAWCLELTRKNEGEQDV